MNISVLHADPDNIYIPDEIKEIINKFVDNYPITFVDKGSIDNRADKLSELFWIKNVNENLLLQTKYFVIN